MYHCTLPHDPACLPLLNPLNGSSLAHFISKGHRLMLPCPISPPTYHCLLPSFTPLSPNPHLPIPPPLPLLVPDEWNTCVWGVLMRSFPCSHSTAAASSAARLLKGGEELTAPCRSVSCHWSPIAYLLHQTTPPLSLSLSPMQLTRQRRGRLTDTHTLCMGGESRWVRGLENNGGTSILFPPLICLR